MDAPPCSASAAWRTDSSVIRVANPTQIAAMCRRPRVSEDIAAPKPVPSVPPTRADSGTRTASKYTSAVCAPAWPIFASGCSMRTPGSDVSTSRTEIPLCGGALSSVRAKTTSRSALGALVMKRLLPDSTNESPSRTARVRT